MSELGLAPQIITFPESQRPILLAVVDTEEEFDWSQPCSPGNTGVTAMRDLWRCQRIFESYGLCAMYAADYPVVSDDDGWRFLEEPLSKGTCEVGAHLHPWVTPPIAEDLIPRHTYPGNLPDTLERRKLETITHLLERRMGHAPLAYKAGRYGLGPRTVQHLEQLGYRVDLSLAPAFDYSGDGGPDYERYDTAPQWAGPRSPILMLPTTGAFSGWWPGDKVRLNGVARSPRGERLRIPGVLARLGALDRLRISPEDFTLAEMKKVTGYLHAQGHRVFTLSFHSPSMAIGCTPYVQSDNQREAFLKTIADYCEWFFASLNGVPMAVTEVLNLADSLRPAALTGALAHSGGI
ncbi:MAG: hypothetical protein U0Q16_04430 [Bryobacteraceae bacterium]